MVGKERATHHTLAHVVGLLAVPYGYTVTLWTASAVASAHFGSAHWGEIVGFVLGAMSAFLLLALFGRPPAGHAVPRPVSSVVVANALPLLALVVTPVSLLAPWPPLGFWASSFAATLVYALSLTLFLRMAGDSGDKAS